MRVWNVIVTAVVVGTGVPIWLHHERFGGFNPLQAALAFFFWLNVIICAWELCLLVRTGHIETKHAHLVRSYRGRELALVREFFFSSVPVRRLCSPTLWSGIWSSYAIFDDSYADRRSFGWIVDVGNGLTTLVPSLLFLYGMTFHVLPARLLGVVGLLACWQMWYGTVLYLASFFVNKRHVGHAPLTIAVIVGLSNGLWLGFPILGAYASIVMIYRDSYALFF
jgi:hypothetical protein